MNLSDSKHELDAEVTKLMYHNIYLSKSSRAFHKKLLVLSIAKSFEHSRLRDSRRYLLPSCGLLYRPWPSRVSKWALRFKGDAVKWRSLGTVTADVTYVE